MRPPLTPTDLMPIDHITIDRLTRDLLIVAAVSGWAFTLFLLGYLIGVHT